MSKISRIVGREILDSRGNPTVEAELFLQSGGSCRASVPSGASVGSKEALELRDHDPKRFHGEGVMNAVSIIREKLAPLLIGRDVTDQSAIDKILREADGTENRTRLGANSLLAVSIAAAKAGAKAKNKPLYAHIADLMQRPGRYILPTPMMNLINGGKHADHALDLQELMIVPAGAPSFREAVRWGAEIFHTLKRTLKEQGHSTAVGDEGGFAPPLTSIEEALNTLILAIKRSGYRIGEEIFLALDCAASEFYDAPTARYALQGTPYTAQTLTHYLGELITRYPICSIEDGLDENDWEGFAYQTDLYGNKVQLVGDDLFVTHTALLRKGIEEGVANAILIKANQIGTLTETLEAITCAQNAGYGVIISHRSGETEDTFLADLAVGSSAGQVKTGSMSRSERVAKYNRLMYIEEELKGEAPFAGKSILKGQ